MEVFFATNRRPRPRAAPRAYGSDFNADGIASLRFGMADVSGNRIRIETAPEKLVPDARGAALDRRRSRLGSEQVFEELRRRMRRECRDTLVFVHGYNVSFRDALRDAARVARSLQSVNGGAGVNVFLFSWPSDGSMAPFLAYANDRRDAAASGAALARGLLKLWRFLADLREEDLCDQRMHLLCHSMGNYVLRHAVREFMVQSRQRSVRIFDQVLLVAADEDDDAFEHDHKLRLLPRLARRVNVYFNRQDRAMAISDVSKGNPERLGDEGPRHPFQVPAKVTQIDCTDVVDGLIEHSYYRDCPAVVADISAVLNGVEPEEIPGRRFVEDRNRYRLIPDPA